MKKYLIWLSAQYHFKITKLDDWLDAYKKTNLAPDEKVCHLSDEENKIFASSYIMNVVYDQIVDGKVHIWYFWR